MRTQRELESLRGQTARRDDRLETMFHEYDSLRAELRTIFTLGFGTITLVGATIAAAFAIAYQFDRQEILIVFPAVGIAFAGLLAEFHMYYLTLNSYLGDLEQRINSTLSGSPVLAWHSGVLKAAWPSPPIAGALHHDLPVAFGGTAIFILILVLGSIYVAALSQNPWESALMVAAYVTFYSPIFALAIYRFLFTNPERLRALQESFGQDAS